MVTQHDRAPLDCDRYTVRERYHPGMAGMNDIVPIEALPPMPPAVAKALNEVMGNVKKLGKDERNPFANYKYAGIESFLEMVRPLCADAGLIIIQDEEGFEFKDGADKSGKVLTWLVMTFSFGLAHSSGETWPYRCRRTGMVQASMGSQAFGAAQSYALKSFLRSIGLIATGDTEDADSHEQRELPDVTRKTAYRARKDGDYESLIAEMHSQETKAALKDWGLENRARIEAMPDGWQKHFRDEYQRTMQGLAA
jgi:ERF superfamily